MILSSKFEGLPNQDPFTDDPLFTVRGTTVKLKTNLGSNTCYL